MSIPDEIRQIVDFYDRYYDVAAKYELSRGRKIWLGKKENRICRFCGRNAEQTKFNTTAHAFPEFIGNKSLLSNYECDECNNFFSRTIEDNFDKFTSTERTFYNVDGKKGVPSIRSDDHKSRIEMTERGLRITSQENSSFVALDEVNKELTVKRKTPKFVPRLAYKCLVKMALSMMPEEDFECFKELVQWIMIRDFRGDKIEADSLLVQKSFTPVSRVVDHVAAMLFRRRDDNIYLPHFIFNLEFSNFTYCLALPFSKKDAHLQGKMTSYPSFPARLHGRIPSCNIVYTYLNLSKNEVVSDLEATVVVPLKAKQEA
ncbi:HNH endonuclease [Humidesulfovibrio sp.]